MCALARVRRLCHWTMSQFLAKVEAIRKALGLRPAEELPAPLAISEAMVLMGINANVSWLVGAAGEG